MNIFNEMVDKFDLMLNYLDSDNNDEIIILENKINLLLYKSLDLPYEIAQIIDLEFDLTKQQYENFKII